MENNTQPKKKSLSAKVLLIVAVVSYGIAWLTGWNQNMLSSAFAVLGLIALVLGIVALVRELAQKRARKSQIAS